MVDNDIIMRIRLSTVSLIAVFIFCLSSFYFYEPIFLDEALLKLFYWFMLAILFGFSIKSILYTSQPYIFATPLRLLLLSMFISSLSAFFFWGQSPVLSFRAVFPFLSFVLYFFLIATKPSFKWLMRIIWILVIMYIAVYIFSFIDASNPIFGSFQEKKVDDQRGVFRFFIPGRGFLFLGFFIAISNYLSSKKNYWLWFASGLFIIILAHVIRQYILFSVVIAGWVLFWRVSFLKKIVLLSFSIVSGYYLYYYSEIIQALIFLTEGQVVHNQTEDIRIVAYRYFFTEFGQNFLTNILGNGVPHDQSAFGEFYRLVVNQKMRLYLSDVGYAQIYVQFGVLGLLSVLYIFFRSMFANIPRQFLFLKLFLIFVFFSNFMSGYFLSYHNIAAISITLYMFEIVTTEKKELDSILNTGDV